MGVSGPLPELSNSPNLVYVDLSNNTLGKNNEFWGSVNTLYLDSEEKLYVGGYFATYSGVTTFNKIVKLNNNGTVDTSFTPEGRFDAYTTLQSIVKDSSGHTYISGNFYTFNGLTQQQIIRLNSGGTLDSSFGNETAFTGTINTIAIDSSDRAYVGGDFSSYESSPQYYFIRFNTDGTPDETVDFSNKFNGNINKIVMDDDKFYVGGFFHSYNYITSEKLVRVNLNGDIDSTFDIGTGFEYFQDSYNYATVYAIALDSTNNKIYVGGYFNQFNGSPQNYLIRLNYNGSKDETFNIGTGFNGTVRTISLGNNKVYVGGEFTSFNGSSNNYFVTLDSGGTLIQSGFGFNNYVYCSEVNSSGKVYVGGVFTECSGTTQKYMISLNSDGTKNTAFNCYQPTYMMDLTNNQSISNLLMPSCNISYLHDSLSALTSMSSLDLSNNNLSVFPNMSLMTSLSSLNLNNNIISESIPDTLSGATNLYYAYFNNNRIPGTIPEWFSTMTTSALHLSNNQLTGEVPLVFSAMTNLQQLRIDGNYFTSGFTNLSGKTTYQELWVAFNNFSGSTMFDLSVFTNLTNADFSYCNLDGTLTLPSVYYPYNYLFNNNNFIGDIPSIPEQYSGNQAYYNVSNNQFTGYTSMVGSQQYFYEIDFSNNYLPTNEINKVLADAAKTNWNYGQLNLSGPEMGIPNGQGLIDWDYLVTDKSWTVSVNAISAGDGGFNRQLADINIDSNDNIYASGYFTKFSGSTQKGLARIDSGGTKSTTFDIGNGFTGGSEQVWTIDFDSSGHTYAGGAYDTFNNSPQNYLIRLNSGGTKDYSFDIGSGFDQYVNSVKVYTDDKVIVGGSFRTYKNIWGPTYLAKLNSGGTLDTSFKMTVGFSSHLYWILSDPSGKTYVGGDFSSYQDTSLFYFGKLKEDGLIDTTYYANGYKFNSSTYCGLLENDGKLYIGGGFSQFDGQPQWCLIRLTTGGTLDTSFDIGDGFNSSVRTLAKDNSGKIYAGGDFTSYSGVTQNRLIRLNSDGTKDETFDIGDGFNGTVYGVALDSSGHTYVAGSFSQFSGSTQNYLIRLNSDGTKDETFDIGDGFNSYIYKLEIDSNDKIYVGGYFTTYSGITQNYAARLNSDATLDSTFDMGDGFDDAVVMIKIIDDKIYMGGNFTTYSGLTHNKIVSLNNDGSINESIDLGTGFDNTVYALDINPSNYIYVGGSFVKYDGVKNESYIIKLNTDGTKDTTFDTGYGPNAAVYDINIDSNDKIVISGEFYSYDHISCPRLARLNSDGTYDYSLNIGAGFNGSVNSVCVDSSNDLYVGGQFSTYNNMTQKYLVKLNSGGTVDTNFNVTDVFTSGITSIVVDENINKIYVGGRFTEFSGVTQNRLIRLNTDGTFDNTFDIGTGFDNVVEVLKLDGNGKLLVGGQFSVYDGIAYNKIIRLNDDGTIDNTFVISQTIEMDESNLLMFMFRGIEYNSATIIVNGASYVMSSTWQGVIWDYLGAEPYQFSNGVYTTIVRNLNGTDFDIRYVSGYQGYILMKISLHI
jgi:uncharacterized delta-60 repeat protein